LIPNRYHCPLDPVEALAEGGDLAKLEEAAEMTGNWALLHVIHALNAQARARQRREKRRFSKR